MKIVFAGYLETVGWVSTCWSRMKELEVLGHSVVPVDIVGPLGWGGRWIAGASGRLEAGPGYWKANRLLLDAVELARPDVVWIELGSWTSREVLAKIREKSTAVLIHYSPDPAFVVHESRRFDSALPFYDLVVTTKRYEVEEYWKRGAREVLVQFPSYDRDVHRRTLASKEESARYEADVVFVGTYAPGRERFLEPLASGEFRLRIWGERWGACRSQRVARFVEGRGVGGREYALSLSAGKIGLGILSPLCPDRSTTRSIEIPACGTFLLAERTEEHQELFTEGVEAEFFGDEDELLRKVRHYLRDEKARLRIAEAGRFRCIDGGYSSRERVRDVVERAQPLLERRRKMCAQGGGVVE